MAFRSSSRYDDVNIESSNEYRGDVDWKLELIYATRYGNHGSKVWKKSTLF